MTALLDAPTAADYLWAKDAWWRHDAHPGFNAYNDRLGQQFAEKAIEAQPLDYLRVVARDVGLLFAANDRPDRAQHHDLHRAAAHPHLPPYYAQDERQYAGSAANTHFVEPYAYFLFLYQLPVYFPGVVFLAVVIAGLVGIVRRWRSWGGVAALPWALAAVSIVLPAMLTQSLYRYTIVAIPLACVAAGLAFTRADPDPQPEQAGPPGGGTAEAAPPSG